MPKHAGTGIDIRVTPPGPRAQEIVDRDSKYVATSTKTSPVVAESGSGSWIRDVDGNTLLDFTSGIGVLNTGFSHPRVLEAIKAQADKLIHFAGTDFYYDIQTQLAKRLSGLLGGEGLYKTFFTNSGTESVEACLKVTRWATHRQRHIAFIGAFHGRTLGSLSLTASKAVHQDRFFPTMPGVEHLPFAYCYRCPYGMEYPSCDLHCARILDEWYLDRYIPGDEVASLFMEVIQGEGGYIPAPEGWPEMIQKICGDHGIKLVVDEVQTGFGRTGKMFGFQHYDIDPDVIAIAKGMGSGLPIGACVLKEELDFQVQGAHSNTYGGNLLASAAAMATIDVIEEEDLAARSARMGEVLTSRLLELQERHEVIGDVRGKGLMQVIELVRDRQTKEYAVEERDTAVERAYKEGLVLLPCGKSGIRFLPPLIILEEEMDMGLEVLDGVLAGLK